MTVETRDEKILREAFINIGKRLYERRLVVARSGNLSCRLPCRTTRSILITATAASLQALTDEEIIRVDLDDPGQVQNKRLTSEFNVHSLIYSNFSNKVVLHCHPPLTNAYFAVYPELKNLTLESKLYLGNVPVVEQETPSITKPQLVIEALKTNNLVVIRNHGVVVIADTFEDALYLVETLEEAVKTAAVARLFKKEVLDGLDSALQRDLAAETVAHEMFSLQHIQTIVDLVNKDEFIAAKGRELDLTVELVIKMDGTGKAYKFSFEKGKIAALTTDAQAPFVISAPTAVWEQVFLGKLDSFVAVTQGKMKLQGQLGLLSRWYVPFSRLFQIFKQVPFK